MVRQHLRLPGLDHRQQDHGRRLLWLLERQDYPVLQFAQTERALIRRDPDNEGREHQEKRDLRGAQTEYLEDAGLHWQQQGSPILRCPYAA